MSPAHLTAPGLEVHQVLDLDQHPLLPAPLPPPYMDNPTDNEDDNNIGAESDNVKVVAPPLATKIQSFTHAQPFNYTQEHLNGIQTLTHKHPEVIPHQPFWHTRIADDLELGQAAAMMYANEAFAMALALA